MDSNHVSEARQIETAMGFVLASVREHGDIPRASRGAWRVAVRIVRAGANRRGGWRPRLERMTLYLEAAGFDPVTGRIVDYEKYYAHRDAWAEKRKAKKRKRLDTHLK